MTEKDKPKIKKWIVPGKVLVAAGGKKDLLLIWKPLKDYQNRHLTLVIKQSGYVELHLTEEGTKNIHTILATGQVNFDKLKSEAEKLMKRALRPIGKNDRRFKDFTVLIPTSIEALEDFQQIFVQKDRFIYPTKEQEQKVESELEKYFDITYFDEIENEGSLFALALSSNGKRMYYMFSDDGEKYYFFPISRAVKALPESIDWKERLPQM